MRDLVKKFAASQKEQQSLFAHTGIADRIRVLTKDPIFIRKIEAEQSSFYKL
jgi:hypothetical protein